MRVTLQGGSTHPEQSGATVAAVVWEEKICFLFRLGLCSLGCAVWVVHLLLISLLLFHLCLLFLFILTKFSIVIILGVPGPLVHWLLVGLLLQLVRVAQTPITETPSHGFLCNLASPTETNDCRHMQIQTQQ